eukprot:TRINITY_DN1509_c0_g1_i2.p1 TRINITY_DN1509_c0_g1~~TRINITY_DN1509_c0_g1_i2.p1  ORF type:complete len:549 (+),score=114.24 TRINITY_DN1509_c0_g1_i2:113-1759(+)
MPSYIRICRIGAVAASIIDAAVTLGLFIGSGPQIGGGWALTQLDVLLLAAIRIGLTQGMYSWARSLQAWPILIGTLAQVVYLVAKMIAINAENPLIAITNDVAVASIGWGLNICVIECVLVVLGIILYMRELDGDDPETAQSTDYRRLSVSRDRLLTTESVPRGATGSVNITSARDIELESKMAMVSETLKEEVMEILISRDLALARALCASLPGSSAKDTTIALVRCFDARAPHNTHALVFSSIQDEVQRTRDAGTLFRGTTAASWLVGAFVSVHGRTFIQNTLRVHVARIVREAAEYESQGLQSPCEIDPLKLKEGDDLYRNMQKLRDTAYKLLKALVDTACDWPPELRVITHQLQQAVMAKFPEAQYSAVGGLVFLRFICPALLTPQSFGLLDTPPSANARRSFVLCAKLLQNLASDVEFGDKEQFMVCMNDFIVLHQATLRQFLDSLVTNPPSVPEEDDLTGVTVALSPQAVGKDDQVLWKIICARISVLTQALSTSYPAYARKLHELEEIVRTAKTAPLSITTAVQQHSADQMLSVPDGSLKF